jgi:uncharacterized protein (DUF2141 family)
MMLRLTVLLVSVLSMGGAQQLSAQSGGTLQLEFVGLQNSWGQVMVAVYRSPQGWPSEDAAAYRTAVVSIQNKKASCTFPDLPAGTYAVAAYHDANRNRKMDTNFLGIPLEAYGFSQGARGTMGPPDFKSAMLEVPATSTLRHQIQLR